MPADRTATRLAGRPARPRQEGGPRPSQDLSRRRARRRQDLRHADGGARREGRRARRRRRPGRNPWPRRKPRRCSTASKSLPRKPIVYRNRIAARSSISTPRWRGSPSLLLVDEYAHTNVPGSRHPKRWQDIEELLAAGIDVWTTLNIQHLESLNDVIQQITGVRVRETVPDSVFDKADEIVLVDLPPDELLKRLAEGKVYVQDTAARAVENFFKPQNLTALRELALRRAAERIDCRPGRAHAGAGDRRPLGRRRAHPRLRRPGSDLTDGRAHGQASGRPDGCALDRGDGRAARASSSSEQREPSSTTRSSSPKRWAPKPRLLDRQ